MSSSGPDFVAVPASLLPADAALVLMTSVDLRPPRLPEIGEPELWRVVAGADLCEQMTPQAEATYLLKFLYKAPLLAARVRLELLRRRREQKFAQWRKTAKENRSADVKRKRAAAAATAGRSGRWGGRLQLQCCCCSCGRPRPRRQCCQLLCCC